MDDFARVEHGERLQALPGDLTQPIGGEVLWELAFLNVLVDVICVSRSMKVQCGTNRACESVRGRGAVQRLSRRSS